MKSNQAAITKGSGAIFADLGFSPAESRNLHIRAQMMAALRKFIEKEGLTQAEAARRLKVTQPRVSDLTRGKFSRFSLDTLVNMLTDALPAAALAVSPQTATGQADQDESAMWRAIGARATTTTAGATLAWLLASTVPGTQRRTATVSLIGLVCTQMMQTLTDSHGPLVAATTAGSFTTMVGVVSTPGLSQLFGCTPIGPFGWGQAFFAAAAASALSAVAPGALDRVVEAVRSVVVDDDDAGAHEDRVDVAERRGQHPDGAAEQRILSETAK